MEIRFSKEMPAPSGIVRRAALDQKVLVAIGKENHYSCRFTLATDEHDHDRVIRALLTLDPDATVRTARAVFQGLADFEKQRGKV